jgi:hypothetical protein
MLLAKDGMPRVKGEIGLWDVLPSGVLVPRARKQNQIQLSWATIVCQQIGYRRRPGRRDYAIAGMYIEFENVADPEDAVDVPTDFDRSENLDYYTDLLSSGVRDYLRVPLTQEPLLSIADGYEAYFAEGEGNRLTFLALTAGSEGVTGKAFSSAANSKICGAALVAMPVSGDSTQDVIFSRTYFAEEDQVVKEAPKQVAVTWQLDFE